MAESIQHNRLVDIQSLVDTHNNPFVVVDENYCILAVNKPFEDAFDIDRKKIAGQKCYEIFHLDETAFKCNKEDPNCPYYNIFTLRQPCSCQHIHYDQLRQLVRVQIKAFPLTGVMHKTLLGMSVQKFAVEKKIIAPKEAKLVGQSPVFIECMSQLERAAKTNMPVLLTGETGTGKEMAATFIHNNSTRREKPLITVDCTVLPENLFESELFGHEKGAFTGSIESKKGIIELAEGGTLFFDEIGEMPLVTQSKLLRVIETGDFRRIGSTKIMKANARQIFATNRELLESVKLGRFRQDLYYRIAVFIIHMPPLRERLSDVPILSEAILSRISETTSISYSLDKEALDLLVKYNYPGNIRELRNILQLAATYSQNGLITVNEIRRYAPFSEIPSSFICSTHLGGKAISEIEAQHIINLLKQFKGKRRDVAKAMGISERTLYRKMKLYGIK